MITNKQIQSNTITTKPAMQQMEPTMKRNSTYTNLSIGPAEGTRKPKKTKTCADFAATDNPGAAEINNDAPAEAYFTITNGLKFVTYTGHPIQSNTEHRMRLKYYVRSALWPVCKFPNYNSNQGKMLEHFVKTKLRMTDQQFKNCWPGKNGIRNYVSEILRINRASVIQQLKLEYFGKYVVCSFCVSFCCN